MNLSTNSKPRHAFTLLELLVTITIIAALVAGVIVVVPSFVSWAKSNSDKQTLTILNDALSRYKTQGGGVSGLTASSNIGSVLAKLRNGVTWGGRFHQFLDKGVTYPARSLSATGAAAQYHFYRYNSYQSETPAAAPSYPYGAGVGYIAVDTSGDYGQGINFTVYSTTGYFAVSYEGTTPQALDTNNWTYQYVNTLGHWPANCTFWACAGASDTTPSGQILLVDCDDINDGSGSNSNVTSVDFSGLTALINLDIGNNQITSVSVPNTLQTFYCQYNQLTSFNVSGFTSLVDINIEGNPLTSINISNTAITSLDCTGNSALTSLNVSGCTALATLRCESASITSLDVSGLTSLTFLYCPNTTLTSLNASGCPNLNTLYCDGSHLGTINITGHQPSTFVYTPQAGGYTPTVIGP